MLAGRPVECLSGPLSERSPSNARRSLKTRRDAVRLGVCHPSEPGITALVATELRASSFEMAFRIRALGCDGGRLADGRYSVALPEVATGSPLALPDQIRRELLAVEADASDYP
jgi:hypothetical protein